MRCLSLYNYVTKIYGRIYHNRQKLFSKLGVSSVLIKVEIDGNMGTQTFLSKGFVLTLFQENQENNITRY